MKNINKESITLDIPNDSDLVSIVETLTIDDIYVDAIYLDNNIKENVHEVQINNVEYINSTYLNNTEYAHVYLQSNQDSKVVISFYKNGKLIKDEAIKVQKGYSTHTFELDTSVPGDFNYEINKIIYVFWVYL